MIIVSRCVIDTEINSRFSNDRWLKRFTDSYQNPTSMRFLSDFVYDPEIIPSKFNIYRKDRKSRGGGVLVAVSESLQSSIIPSPENLELISVSITHRHTIIICTVYIPPNSDSDYLNSLFLYLSNLITLRDHIILVGDFNFPDINWDTLSGSSLSSKSFCDFVFQNNLSQLVHSPTHLKGNILDLVLTLTNISAM